MSESNNQARVEVEEGPEARPTVDECGRAERELTYHVRLVLDNDEPLYHQRCAMVHEHLAARDECVFCDGTDKDWPDRVGQPPSGRGCEHCGGAGKRPRYPHQLGDKLKDWCEELCGLDYVDEATDNGRDSMLGRELLSTALAWVDWTEIAKDYIREEIESDPSRYGHELLEIGAALKRAGV